VALVVVGSSEQETLDAALAAFEASGFRQLRSLEPPQAGDGVVGLIGGGAADLAAADRRGVRYVLVHVGRGDAVAGGTFERAHHRISLDQLQGTAARLRTRDKTLVRCLAFAYKNGLPEDAAWLIDVRFLANPYWVEELRDLGGQDERVRQYVLSQAAALELLERLESDLRWMIPLYHLSQLTVAFGCTGGRHRSVVVATEMAKRLQDMEGVEVVFEAREADL
jgi:P-loop ATPase protein family